ncbi:unnamed protein product [Candidula unifasciata]|uniref:Cytochrome P450 n=1 Tax=Candidula unifasciata TaxID=100452 RepID=A0A8S3ZME5_9EUPU|nr:unnamed protein product [Candidula unifasciata]
MFDEKIGAHVAFGNWQLRYGRLIGVFLFRKPVLIVSSPEALKQIFVKDFASFSDRYFVGEGKLQQQLIQKTIFFAEGPVWRRLRKMITPTFSSGKLRQLTQYINKKAALLEHYLHSHAVSETSTEAKLVFGAHTLDIIAGTTFGIDLDSLSDLNAPFIQHAKSLMTVDRLIQLKLALAGIFPVLIPFLRLFNIGYFKQADIQFFEDTLKTIILERTVTSKGKSDFIQMLLEAEFEPTEGIHGDTKLTTEELVAQGLFFLIAAYDAGSNVLQFLFYELAKHQDVQDKVVKEIQTVIGQTTEPTYDNCKRLRYTEAVIEEVLRMYPPVHILTRTTTQETVLNGIRVPANIGIIIPVYNIGRDPEFFPNPDKFNPDRFMQEHRGNMNPATFLPFGFGPRQCIAVRLVIMQFKIALVHVMRKLRAVSATPEVMEVADHNGTIVPKIPIRISFEVRAS